MSRYFFSILSAGIFLSFHTGGIAEPPGRGKTILNNFNFKNVRLHDGFLGKQREQTRKDYLGISNDGLLKVFRQRAGKPATGPDLGGWYSASSGLFTGGLFHNFGQILSGLARLYAGSGDEACREKAALLIHEWALCMEPDGYFFSAKPPASPHYVYEKTLCGLLDNYVFCGNEEALQCLLRITVWADKNLSRNHHPWNPEWYTLSENLYRAWLVTGDKKFFDFAKEWEYPDYWDLYANQEDIFSKLPLEDGKPINGYHAYSHVNTLSGAAAAYEATGDPHYLKVIVNAYDTLQREQCFATGGYGPIEQLMKRKDLVGSLDHPYFYKHFETQCGSWAAFKLSKYLIRFTGRSEYGNWIERLMYNGIGASIPMHPQGHVMYDSDYHTGGGFKRNTNEPWSCCSGTRPMAVADYVDLLYFHDKDNLYVNIFTPSSLEWQHDGTTVKLLQKTDFPKKAETELQISVSKPVRFGLRIRIPDWLSSPITATLNGKPVELTALDSGWCELKRQWEDGDALLVSLPMQLEVKSLEKDKPYPAALVCGPVVLATGTSGTSPANRIDLDNIRESLVPVPGEPLHFQTRTLPILMAKPFYEFREGERYFMYLDPKWTNKISPHHFQFNGKWIWGTTEEAGAWAECLFEGHGLRWSGDCSEKGGRAQITLDGKDIAVIDQKGKGEKFLWEKSDPSPGKHLLRFTHIAGGNPDSPTSIHIGTLETLPLKESPVSEDDPLMDLTYFLRRLRTLDHLPEIDQSHTALSSTWDRSGGNLDGWDFKRIEKNTNILLDVGGPGCIHRIFTGWLGYGRDILNKPGVQGTRIQIILDNADTPIIDMPVEKFFDDRNGLFPYPLVFHKTYPGALMPIPYAKHCRVQLNNPESPNWGNFWQITYTTYPSEKRVESFRLPLSEAETKEMSQVREAWLDAESREPLAPSEWGLHREMDIDTGKSEEISLEGCGMIRQMRISVWPGTPELLRGIRMQILWDGSEDPSVDLPLGYFFGNADYAYSNEIRFHSLLLGVNSSEAYSRFPMPFDKGAVLRFENRSESRAFRVRVFLDIEPCDEIPANWGRFHATW
ncbi:glycoside hydrolase family 127 protein, partial [Candidatus Sumerlaeota bacterium]|nr:glycoside hydrolase family 127 protein [Candidatus Sumerlaeota bacterium]